MIKKLLALAALLIFLATTSRLSAAPDPLLADEPGYVDVTAIAILNADDLEMHVSVKGPLLQLVANASRGDDPEFAEALAALAGIEVRVYTIAEQRRSTIREGLAQLSKKLTAAGWSTAITVQVNRDHGYAMLRLVEGRPLGLAAFYLTDDNQAIFVNIVGHIDTATIGRLARKYDLDLLAVPNPDPPAESDQR